MNITKVTDDTYQLLANVRGFLFEGLWEIPNGVSINSYIIKGEKTAIIDGFGGWDGAAESLYDLLDEIDVKPESIEYLIINHMEPDHSQWLEDFNKINPNVKIVCSKTSADLLEAFYNQTENIIIANDDFELDLGNGHKLSFAMVPNVHWPDSMVTFDLLTKTLFSCDAFGSFGEVGENKFDDMLSEEELAFYEAEAVRYYSNIIGSFSMFVKRAIDKCAPLPIEIIAPGHGIMWRGNVDRIISDYSRYVEYQKGIAKEEITLIWGSMYGMTEKAVNHAVKVLEGEDIKVNVHRVPDTDDGTILASVWNSTGVILAMPTYEYKMFPALACTLEELGRKKAHGRKAFRFGSYGWSGGAQKQLDEIMENHKMNWEFLEPVEFKGNAKEDDLNLIEQRIKELVKEVKAITKP
ncbi:MAG: FprA family A-type flavoprotein [Epulopiscium sp.]|nr:FprA family A-type flavoprotein [Candidatus Epulonipiscium sp.]